MNKTPQDLKVETEFFKEENPIQSKSGNKKNYNWNRNHRGKYHQCNTWMELDDRMSHIEDTIEEMAYQSRKI